MEDQTSRTVRFVVAFSMLVAIAVGLTILTVALAQAAGGAGEEKTRQYLTRLAITTLCLLGLILVFMGAMGFRFIRSRFQRQDHEPTPYVDAWAEAGRRFELPKDEDDQSEADES